MSLEKIDELLDKLTDNQFRMFRNNNNYMRHFQRINMTEIELEKIDKIWNEIVDFENYDPAYVKYIKIKIAQEKAVLEIYKEHLLKEQNLTG